MHTCVGTCVGMHMSMHVCIQGRGLGVWWLVQSRGQGMSSQTVAFLDVLRKEMFSSGTG